MMRSKQQLNEAANAQIATADYIPFGSHIAPDIILNKYTGDYVMTWRLDGISFETSDPQDILARKEGIVSLLRSLSGGHWAVWSHKVRRVVHERLDAHYDNAFCDMLNRRYYERFATYKQMATELYLTVIYRPEPSKTAGMFRRIRRTIDEMKQQQEADLALIEDMVKQLEVTLKRYRPQRLSTFHRHGRVYSEMLSFFSFLTNGVWEDVPLCKSDIGEYLPVSRLFFGDQNGLVEIRHPNEHKFAGFLDFQEYPGISEPGMCNSVLYSDYEYIETQSFSILGRRHGMEVLKRQQGRLISAEDASNSEVQDMTRAMDMLQSGEIEVGEYHYTLAVFGDTLEQVSRNVADARVGLQDGPGFKVSVIDAVPECAWFAQLPGNWSMRPREAKLTSRNFACLSPFHNFARGKKEGNPWGEAVALLMTPSAQPYYMNFHVSPDDTDSTDEKYPGNTFICGTTGVGKTTLAVSLVAFALKYPKLRVMCFDKDRGMEIGIRAMGGRYSVITRGVPTGFNPFQLPPTEENIQFCENLVALLINPGNQFPLSSKEQQDISKAVRTVMSEHVSFPLRRLSTVAQSLPVVGENNLKLRINKWLAGQPLGWVFDNPMDLQDFSKNRLFGYDYTDFLDDAEVCTPVMAYLLHITESLIDGDPFIYYMTEFWKPLMNPFFTGFARDKQKTIRKQNGLGIFDTQSPSDVLEHAIGKTMVEQSVTKIFLPNPGADYDDYVNGFKVTEAEFKIIRNLGENSRRFLIKQGHQSAVVQFDLGGMNDILNVISGSLDNVELLDQIRAEVGDHPDDFLPVLHQRIARRRNLLRKPGD